MTESNLSVTPPQDYQPYISMATVTERGADWGAFTNLDAAAQLFYGSLSSGIESISKSLQKQFDWEIRKAAAERKAHNQRTINHLGTADVEHARLEIIQRLRDLFPHLVDEPDKPYVPHLRR